MFDPRVIPPIIGTVELRDPKSVVIFYNSLRAGAPIEVPPSSS